MKNFVPLGTGNSRLMKSNIPAGTTWEQAIAMLNSGTFPYDTGQLNAAGISVEGTPLNKQTLLQDSTAQQFGLTGDATVDAVLQILKNAAVVNSAGNALETVLGSTLLTIPGVRIATGSYVGTGTYGADNPCTLTFDFKPKLWGIYCYTQSRSPTLVTVTFRVPFGLDVTGGQKHLVGFIGNNPIDIQVHYIGQTVYWNAYDYPGASPSAAEQLNDTGNTYYYFAIG